MTTHRAPRAIPAHQPGVVITLTLEQLPVYLDTHQLVAMTRGEVTDHERKSGTRKPAGVLYVRPVTRKET